MRFVAGYVVGAPHESMLSGRVTDAATVATTGGPVGGGGTVGAAVVGAAVVAGAVVSGGATVVSPATVVGVAVVVLASVVLVAAIVVVVAAVVVVSPSASGGARPSGGVMPTHFAAPSVAAASSAWSRRSLYSPIASSRRLDVARPDRPIEVPERRDLILEQRLERAEAGAHRRRCVDGRERVERGGQVVGQIGDRAGVGRVELEDQVLGRAAGGVEAVEEVVLVPGVR